MTDTTYQTTCAQALQTAAGARALAGGLARQLDQLVERRDQERAALDAAERECARLLDPVQNPIRWTGATQDSPQNQQARQEQYLDALRERTAGLQIGELNAAINEAESQMRTANAAAGLLAFRETLASGVFEAKATECTENAAKAVKAAEKALADASVGMEAAQTELGKTQTVMATREQERATALAPLQAKVAELREQVAQAGDADAVAKAVQSLQTAQDKLSAASGADHTMQALLELASRQQAAVERAQERVEAAQRYLTAARAQEIDTRADAHLLALAQCWAEHVLLGTAPRAIAEATFSSSACNPLGGTALQFGILRGALVGTHLTNARAASTFSRDPMEHLRTEAKPEKQTEPVPA